MSPRALLLLCCRRYCWGTEQVCCPILLSSFPCSLPPAYGYYSIGRTSVSMSVSQWVGQLGAEDSGGCQRDLSICRPAGEQQSISGGSSHHLPFCPQRWRWWMGVDRWMDRRSGDVYVIYIYVDDVDVTRLSAAPARP